ncbi:MAG: hypothetical protein JSV89_00090 [Spirochaetaceae bacterium]|nr:MAG: hypothetical protein JSV89_00090 [Spirochaetaceae bacterium]
MKVVTLIICSLCMVGALSAQGVDSNSDGRADQWYELSAGRIEKVSMDRNFDTVVDYNVEYDLKHQKVYEEMDFNHDGQMDDFYYFEDGKLIRQEIDSNFDGAVDIWVYLDGMYILKYEMDSDFDGNVDLIKDYEQ